MIDIQDINTNSESLSHKQSGPVFWAAICRMGRVEGIMRAEEIICRYGHIIDFKYFSDLELSMVIEIAESKIAELSDELSKIMALSLVKGILMEKDAERSLIVNIAFTSGEGLLRTEVPAV